MSTVFKLDGIDWKKIGTGALIAGAGAGSIYVLEFLGGLDFGIWTPAAVALASILANLVRKWMANKP